MRVECARNQFRIVLLCKFRQLFISNVRYLSIVRVYPQAIHVLGIGISRMRVSLQGNNFTSWSYIASDKHLHQIVEPSRSPQHIFRQFTDWKSGIKERICGGEFASKQFRVMLLHGLWQIVVSNFRSLYRIFSGNLSD